MTSGIAPALVCGKMKAAKGLTPATGAVYIGRSAASAIERDQPVPRRIYLDHASTTPILPEAAAAMAQACGIWANPSSPHAEGRAVRAQLEDARRRIAAALGSDSTLIFTSGATEAIELVFRRARAKSFIISSVEHPAVLRSATGARQIAVRGDGTLDLDDLDGALEGAEAPLVAVQSVNNETGVIHPIADIAARVRAAGGLLLTDCAQSAGKLPLPDADFLVVAAHKLGGPPGIGALLIRDPAKLEAIGGQEGGFRPGTAAVPAIMAFAAAVEADHGWYEEAVRLRARLDAGILDGGGEVIGAEAPRIATIAAYRMPGVTGAAQMMQFDLAGIAISAGSACASGSLKTSHVLTAMGWSEEQAREVIRVSFGPGTSEADIDALLAEWRALADKRRAA
jgi:cysteine desulfurase